jgi:2'-5' RNA ligase
MTKRIFIAIKINPNSNFLKKIEEIKTDLKNSKIKWVNYNNFHLTLKFLGDTQTYQIEKIITELQKIAKQTKTFKISIKDFGVFPNTKKPRILWFGIDNDEKISEIATKINTNLSKYNFNADNKAFKPHLTIGRIKFTEETDKIKKHINNLKNRQIQEINIDKIILYESILKKEGPTYKAIKEILLEQ